MSSPFCPPRGSDGARHEIELLSVRCSPDGLTGTARDRLRADVTRSLMAAGIDENAIDVDVEAGAGVLVVVHGDPSARAAAEVFAVAEKMAGVVVYSPVAKCFIHSRDEAIQHFRDAAAEEDRALVVSAVRGFDISEVSAAMSALLGDDFVLSARPDRWVWHSMKPSVRIVDVSFTGGRQVLTCTVTAGVVSGEKWFGMPEELRPSVPDQVTQLPIDLHGTYTKIGRFVIHRPADKTPDDGFAFDKVLSSLTECRRRTA